MADIKLSPEEAQILRTVLNTIVVRDRTGEFGILHGLERLVSTHRPFTKPERTLLDAALRKLGLPGIRLHRS